jgi:hypothetical protein
MRNVTGQYRIRYADVLRAIGFYLDTSHFHDLTLVETPDGFVITGHSVMLTERGPAAELQSYLFADADIELLIEQAFERRGSSPQSRALLPTVVVGNEHVRYEDVLRCIGTLIEERNWHAVAVIQTSAGFNVKGFHGEKSHDTSLGAAALRKMLDELPHRRRQRRRWPW